MAKAAKKDTVEKISYNLQLDEQIQTHLTSWKIQRFGWTCMLVTAIAALLGLCGNGPLSYRTTAVNNDTLHYQYFLRYQGHAELKLSLQQQTGITRIGFPVAYWQNFQVEKVMPEPFESHLQNDTVWYFFNGKGKGVILFFWMPQQRGSLRGSLLVNSETFSISHFIYP